MVLVGPVNVLKLKNGLARSGNTSFDNLYGGGGGAVQRTQLNASQLGETIVRGVGNAIGAFDMAQDIGDD